MFNNPTKDIPLFWQISWEWIWILESIDYGQSKESAREARRGILEYLEPGRSGILGKLGYPAREARLGILGIN